MKDIFKCSVAGCDKMYVNSAILRRHVQAFHCASNKFQCKSCGKALASRQNLKEHSFIHSGEKPYACTELGCTMSFRQGTHLSAHKKVHQKPNCPISLKFLLEKLSESACVEEASTIQEGIFLPEIETFQLVSVLPNIF